MIGAISCGRRKVCLTERAPSAATTRAFEPAQTHAGGSSDGAGRARRRLSSPSRWSPVLATKTSSSVGSTRSSDSTAMPGLVERPDDGRDVGRRRARARPAPCRPSAGSGLPKRAQTSSACSASPSSEPDLEVRAADLGLERGRRALGDDLAVVDDPDPVGELVGLLEVLGGEEDGRALVVERFDLLPDRLAADRVEAGGRLVEEEDARLVDERRGEVEPAAHAARVGADPAVGGLDEARPGRAAPRRGARPSARRQAVQRRLEAGSARGRSSAGRARPPGARRRSSARTARGLGDDVVAGDRGAAAGRAQERGQHPHRGRLAGAVRAEEGVDLALGDLEVDPVDGLEPLAKLRSRPVTSIAATRGNRTGGDSRLKVCIARAGPKQRAGKVFSAFPWPHPTIHVLRARCRRGARSPRWRARRAPRAPTRRTLGQTARTPAASCPKTPCQAVGRTT